MRKSKVLKLVSLIGASGALFVAAPALASDGSVGQGFGIVSETRQLRFGEELNLAVISF